MPRSSRVARTQGELLRALDDHQFLLREALQGLSEDRSRIKTLATELRTLICMSSGTEGLLWRLVDELKVSDVIELHVAESVNRDHPLNRGLAIWQIPLGRAGEDTVGPPAALRHLRDVIKRCEAIYVAQIPDRVFTHELLIGAIAGQMGGAHEAEGLDYSLVKLNSFLINRTELYFKVLAFDAELTLQIGERVLDQAEQSGEFRRARRPADFGDVTICVRFAKRKPLAGRLPMFTLRSPVSESEITCSAAPQSTLFTLRKRGVVVAELRAAYPANWPNGVDALFTLSYSSAHRKARTITNDQVNGEAVPCEFRWLDARELRLEPHAAFEDFILLRCIPLYGRLLRPKECAQILQVSLDGKELMNQNPDSGPFPC
jgi:hypothetical protein